MRTEIREKEIIVNKIKEENDTLIKIRLVFLNLVGNYGMKVKEASEAIGISKRTGYEWIRWWNECGYGEMKRKRGGTGRPPKLNEEKMKELKEMLKEKEHWTTREVKEEIKRKFGVKLSEDQVRRILKNNLKMDLSKPYLLGYRREEDAEEILDERLSSALKELKEKEGIREEEIAIGFVGETSPQLTSNTVRVWSFGKPRIVKNTTKMKVNIKCTPLSRPLRA